MVTGKYWNITNTTLFTLRGTSKLKTSQRLLLQLWRNGATRRERAWVRKSCGNSVLSGLGHQCTPWGEFRGGREPMGGNNSLLLNASQWKEHPCDWLAFRDSSTKPGSNCWGHFSHHVTIKTANMSSSRPPDKRKSCWNQPAKTFGRGKFC